MHAGIFIRDYPATAGVFSSEGFVTGFRLKEKHLADAVVITKKSCAKCTVVVVAVRERDA